MVTGLDDIALLDNTPPTAFSIAIRAIFARLVTAPPYTTKLIVAAVRSASACIILIGTGGASIPAHVSPAARASRIVIAVMDAP